MAIGPNEDHLFEANKSLSYQTFRDFEVLYQREEGLAEARNQGFKNAQGEYVAIQDADDISGRLRFEKEVAYLDKHRDVSVVGSWGRRIGDRDGVCTPPEVVTFRKLRLWDRVIHSSAMLRKKDVMKFGPYCDVMFEDWDLWMRLTKAGLKIRNIPEVLVSFRFSSKSHSSSINRRQWYREQILQRLSY